MDKKGSTLKSLAPKKCNKEPKVVILTPGSLNSAYYEHSFLSDQMGIEMVESSDLFVEGKYLYMKTVDGPKRIDVVYRRIDDEYRSNFDDVNEWMKILSGSNIDRMGYVDASAQTSPSLQLGQLWRLL